MCGAANEQGLTLLPVWCGYMGSCEGYRPRALQ